ncbi:HDOD domain-containing protein [Psychromonas sp. PT13]|uniref:HDOD domain-containing protein n=1 Tax=Psychromonas sp. PT13 TaxID=3439547 RepID=UPI003EB7855D
MRYSTLIARISAQLARDDAQGGLLSLPENLLSLRRLCSQQNTDIYDIELAIVKEPAFAAYILKLANSALYSAGKEPCQNIANVIRRLGMYQVSQYALTFALQKCHELENVSDSIVSLLRQNWQLSWSLAQEATKLYSLHRLTGNPAVKKIDLSDLLMLSVLLHTGRLAILTDFNTQGQGESFYDERFISEAANKSNMKLLPILLNHWKLPLQHYHLFSSVPGNNQVLNAVDYLFSAALLNAYPKTEQVNLEPTEYNFLLDCFNLEEVNEIATRVVELGILSDDQFDLSDY